MWGRGLFSDYVNNATSGCKQNIDYDKSYGCVKCDFISLLGYVNTNECWLVYLHHDGTFQDNGFYLLLLNKVDGMHYCGNKHHLCVTSDQSVMTYMLPLSFLVYSKIYATFQNLERIR